MQYNKVNKKLLNNKTLVLKSSKEIIEIAKSVIVQEAQAIDKLSTLVDDEGTYFGIIHLHDIIKEGIL